MEVESPGGENGHLQPSCLLHGLWPSTGALIRRLDDGKGDQGGKPWNRYDYLGGSDEAKQQNLKLFKEWVGIWTLKRWREITKEELDGIKGKY
jgi:PccH Cytochrome c